MSHYFDRRDEFPVLDRLTLEKWYEDLVADESLHFDPEALDDIKPLSDDVLAYTNDLRLAGRDPFILAVVLTLKARLMIWETQPRHKCERFAALARHILQTFEDFTPEMTSQSRSRLNTDPDRVKDHQIFLENAEAVIEGDMKKKLARAREKWRRRAEEASQDGE